MPRQPKFTLFPYTTLFRSRQGRFDHRDGSTHRRNSRDGKLSHVQSQRIREVRSEEHTSELQSRRDLVCRLLLEKKNIYNGVILVDVLHAAVAVCGFLFIAL